MSKKCFQFAKAINSHTKGMDSHTKGMEDFDLKK